VLQAWVEYLLRNPFMDTWMMMVDILGIIYGLCWQWYPYRRPMN
jgi:hypothetical protein